MSSAHTSAARVLPVRETSVPASRPSEAVPRLRLVQAPVHARSRVPFVLTCIGILGAALLGTLVLNTAMADGSYEAQRIKRELAVQAQATDRYQADLDALTSPQALAAQATALGMVQVANPGILRLSDQSIFGGAAAPEAGQ
ncbi:hypothetical protein SAMN05216410_2253 [Sanguibacter gelidistatuariae]|uniref:Cell division protein FtsL n=1 Tax=Sanguibacter gelidistatuariae TaxID=1814289 RepID=A0A1G6NXC4_9MICO|nr:hypothetical protein [Sanguibacter gelidistatuariae]SDC72439.1 hypothetical protein SAMN05216410_2253 [Sanguibacter gelidistatuariae]